MINGNVVNSQLWGGSLYGKNAIAFPISVEQIDRIEIIRGPDSAIYGDNAIFGVVNIITNQSKMMFLLRSAQMSGKCSKSGGANIHTDMNDMHLRVNLYLFQNDGYPLYVSEANNFYNGNHRNIHSWIWPRIFAESDKGIRFLPEHLKEDLGFGLIEWRQRCLRGHWVLGIRLSNFRNTTTAAE